MDVVQHRYFFAFLLLKHLFLVDMPHPMLNRTSIRTVYAHIPNTCGLEIIYNEIEVKRGELKLKAKQFS